MADSGLGAIQQTLRKRVEAYGRRMAREAVRKERKRQKILKDHERESA